MKATYTSMVILTIKFPKKKSAIKHCKRLVYLSKIIIANLIILKNTDTLTNILYEIVLSKEKSESYTISL